MVMASALTSTLIVYIVASRHPMPYIKEAIVLIFAAYVPMAFIDASKVIFWIDTAILMTPAIIIMISRNIWFMMFVFLASLVNTNYILNPFLIEEVMK